MSFLDFVFMMLFIFSSVIIFSACTLTFNLVSRSLSVKRRLAVGDLGKGFLKIVEHIGNKR